VTFSPRIVELRATIQAGVAWRTGIVDAATLKERPKKNKTHDQVQHAKYQNGLWRLAQSSHKALHCHLTPEFSGRAPYV
jgi:hypothetical protein